VLSLGVEMRQERTRRGLDYRSFVILTGERADRIDTGGCGIDADRSDL
jgi:hypothetical protein